MAEKNIIIGISGASGAIYGVRLLQVLKNVQGIKTHLIMSQSSGITLATETAYSTADVQALADYTYSQKNMAAMLSSGSFKTEGMIIAPCSMRSLAEIAHAQSTTLLTRAAEVVLKERRRLVLMVRETPLTLVHIRNMAQVTEMGGIIAPPVPAFYAKPTALEEMVDHTIGRVLDMFDIETDLVRRWQGLPS